MSSFQTDTIDINFQSDLMAIFEENLFWEGPIDAQIFTRI